MNPVGQTIPVIHLHLEGKSEHQPDQYKREIGNRTGNVSGLVVDPSVGVSDLF